MKKTASPLYTAAILLAVCAVCALLVSTVNHITKDRILENQEKEIEETILEIFPEAKELERSTESSPSGSIQQLFTYKNEKGDPVAIAAIAAPKGFREEISLCVVADNQGEILGVRVLSASETPGLGDKACEEEYLDSYKGLTAPVAFGEGVDAVSGATISSRAILNAVNEVLEAAEKGGVNT